jgi:dTDP-4-amino-4,6-dideoxygalactose transaminase
MTSPIPMVDLQAQRRRLGASLDDAIARVLEHGQYILGPEVAELESRLAAYTGAAQCVTCANGTDALEMVFRAEGVGPGDAVFVPAMTFVATAEMVPGTGATPFFVDVRPDTFNIDPASLQAGIAEARRLRLRARLVVAVDLYGQPADYAQLNDIARREDVRVVADAAQSIGGSVGGKRVGGLAPWSTTSFFPAKPLGAYGDAGAVFTHDDERAAYLRSFRFHGRGADKNDNIRLGRNSRLDTLQAAVLLAKLDILDDEIAARQRVARRYNEALADIVQVPVIDDDTVSTWCYYTILVKDRNAVAASCRDVGVATSVCYPIPLHRQTGYQHFPSAPGGLPVATRLGQQVISLPMHPYLDEAAQARVIAAVRSGVASSES